MTFTPFRFFTGPLLRTAKAEPNVFQGPVNQVYVACPPAGGAIESGHQVLAIRTLSLDRRVLSQITLIQMRVVTYAGRRHDCHRLVQCGATIGARNGTKRSG
jgi:hypothetical protein